MPIITFANSKGGAGKTTAVLLLATELARRGYRVDVLDTDPQQWFARWFDVSGRAVRNLDVVSYVTEQALSDRIAESRQRADYTIIDLPGVRSPLLARALGHSDHVLIPVQGCAMDAQGGAHVLEMLKFLADKAKLVIPHSVVLTRVNPLVTTRALAAVRQLLASRNVHVLDTPIVERAAFRDIFELGGTLQDLHPERVSNVDKARENARAFAHEVLSRVWGRLSDDDLAAADTEHRIGKTAA
ncbi:ParA family protein [Rhizobiaceae bacterium BDR2-2]|uniref:ParA family protein n=1 Tax=Ectorhizobium quercum TaxID=2965071 RepID=A0AAE3MZJ8_9HYPH|nr:ParA family protein [Ectorhizobium quercum]MCX8997993.1 ParA family protein [Ectorhizobium quercum]